MSKIHVTIPGTSKAVRRGLGERVLVGPVFLTVENAFRIYFALA
jgi:hypothetical protein